MKRLFRIIITLSIFLIEGTLAPIVYADEAANGLGPKEKDRSHINATVNHIIEAAGSVILLIACNPRKPSFLTYHISTLAFLAGIIAIDLKDQQEMEKAAGDYSIKDLKDEDKLENMADPEKQTKAYDVAAKIQDIASDNAKKHAYLKQALAIARAIASYLAITENTIPPQPDMTCFGSSGSFIGKVPGQILGYVAVAMQAADLLSGSAWAGMATAGTALGAILPILTGVSTNAATRASTYGLSALLTSGLGVVDAILSMMYKDQADVFRELSKKSKQVSLLQILNQGLILIVDEALAELAGQSSCYRFSQNFTLTEDKHCACRDQKNCAPDDYGIRTSTTFLRNKKQIKMPLPEVIAKGASYVVGMNKQLFAGNIDNALIYANKLNQIGPSIFKEIDEQNQTYHLGQSLSIGRKNTQQLASKLSTINRTPMTWDYLSKMERDLFPAFLQKGANFDNPEWLRQIMAKNFPAEQMTLPTPFQKMDLDLIKKNHIGSTTQTNSRPEISRNQEEEGEYDFERPIVSQADSKVDEQYDVENSNINLDPDISIFQVISRRYQNSKIYHEKVESTPGVFKQ